MMDEGRYDNLEGVVVPEAGDRVSMPTGVWAEYAKKANHYFNTVRELEKKLKEVEEVVDAANAIGSGVTTIDNLEAALGRKDKV